ncbi:MAG TPA: hypothetical protein VJH65_03880 [Candidatus Nanoarchaeia archaeon]|nr:hypothetical protein [Candidatus Nanoarchaeia archaeon]
MNDKEYEETIKKLINIKIPLSMLICYEDNLLQSIHNAVKDKEKSKNIEGLVEAIHLLRESFPLLDIIRKPKEELTDKDLLIIYINLDSNARNYFKSIEDYLDNLNKYLSCQL